MLHAATPAETGDLRASSDAVFQRVLSGDLRVEIKQRYPLEDVRRAHEELEGRATSGSTILIP